MIAECISLDTFIITVKSWEIMRLDVVPRILQILSRREGEKQIKGGLNGKLIITTYILSDCHKIGLMHISNKTILRNVTCI